MTQPWMMRHCTHILMTAMVLSGLAALLIQNAWPLLLVLPFTFWRWIYLAIVVRCPRCSRRIRDREFSPLGHRGNPMMYYDCHDCEVTWDPQIYDEMAERVSGTPSLSERGSITASGHISLRPPRRRGCISLA